MAKNKTTETAVSVTGFINKVDDEMKRDDAFELIKIFREITGFEAKMWGRASSALASTITNMPADMKVICHWPHFPQEKQRPFYTFQPLLKRKKSSSKN